MRTVVLFILIFLFAKSFCSLDFYAKTRKFCLDLFYHALQDTGGNVVISPYAIWLLLISIAYNSSGVTREQFKEVFLLIEDRNEFLKGYSNLISMLGDEDVNITILNFIFYDVNLNLRSGGIDRLENEFNFITKRLNFGETQNATNTAIQIFKKNGMGFLWSEDLLTNQDFVDSAMIMCNYLSFEAKWAYPFNISKIYNFKVGHRSRYEQRWSAKARFRYSNFDSLKASVTELPYEGDGKYCMLLLEPYIGYQINDVYRNLKNFSLQDVFAKLQSDVNEFGMREMEVKLPIYFNDTPININKPLYHMGLSSMFTENDANFSNFSEDLYISEVVHKVWISIENTKTRIHSTTPGYNYGDRPRKYVESGEDPFIFFITEKSTATILFAGSYSKYF